MTVLLWALISSAAVLSVEFASRLTMQFQWWFVPIALVVNYSIFRLVTASDTWLGAFLIFGAVNLTSRIVLSTALMHDHISRGLWVALALMYLAILAKGVLK